MLDLEGPGCVQNGEQCREAPAEMSDNARGVMRAMAHYTLRHAYMTAKGKEQPRSLCTIWAAPLYNVPV
jgi:hypothetical protein